MYFNVIIIVNKKNKCTRINGTLEIVWESVPLEFFSALSPGFNIIIIMTYLYYGSSVVDCRTSRPDAPRSVFANGHVR